MTIIASCGHKLEDWETDNQELKGQGYQVQYLEELCDAVDGFSTATIYSTFCFKCTMQLIKDGRYLRLEDNPIVE